MLPKGTVGNWELPDGFRKGRGTRDQIANICWIIEKARVRKNIYFCFIDYSKAFDCLDHNKLWKILKQGNTRTPYLPPEKSVCRSRSNSQNWPWNNRLFQTAKGVCQGFILSPCLFNRYAEYILWNAGLDKAQTGIKIARRNINNLRYADDTTLMAESKEELSLLMKVRGEWKSKLKTQHAKN